MYAHLKNRVPRLEKSIIVREALLLMGEEGLAALTTRRLASRLKVSGPALYWHIGGMDELHADMCEFLIDECTKRVVKHADWQQWLLDNVMELRTHVLQLRDGATLISKATWTNRTKTVLLDRYLDPIVESGIPRSRALQIVAALNSYCLGWMVVEEKDDRRSFLSANLDREALFCEGARVLINGFVTTD